MKDFKVGLQLYSVRDQMEKNFFGTLKAVKEIGYDYVEFAGYFNHTAEEVRSMLDELGLECISVHQGPDLFIEEGQKAVDYLKTIGAKYCAIPWYGIENYSKKKYPSTIEMFKKVSKLLSENGIRLTYHNHDFEFNTLDGEYILDKIYADMGDMIEGEVDTCWVKYAGVDPAAFILKYKGKMKTLHLKDFKCSQLASGPVYALIDKTGKDTKPKSKEENEFRFMPCGKGMQDFPAILAAAEEVGIDYVIVEQDQSYETPSIEAARISREYLKSLGI
ncbi:MAG: sugar phosphate isomerase/epimerase [Clostridia bacterium]|nr:sugar phosphate isomerase/epimerase [Clostridia bacterium]